MRKSALLILQRCCITSLGDPTPATSLSPLAQRHIQRNSSLGVANGAFFGFIEAIVSPSLVLPLFVTGLGGSPILVGLLPAIYTGGWLLPQFLISHRLQRLPRKLAVYTPIAILRIFCWSAFTIATFLISDPRFVLSIFFMLFTIYSLAAGIAGSPFMDIVAKTIPPEKRGGFFGNRDLAGAICAIAGGYVVNYFLSDEMSARFPLNFAYLFLIAAIAIAIGVLSFSFVIEPSEPGAIRTITFPEQLAAAKTLLRENGVYSRYLLTRIFLAISDIASPFYAIYATTILKVPLETVGVYIAIATTASVITNPIWSRVSDRRGNRVLFIGTSLGSVTMPILALTFGSFPTGPSLALPFGLIFAFSGSARTAANISAPSYLLDIAPAGERPLYLGVTNSILGIATFVPVLGGIIVSFLGYPAVLLIALLFSGLAVRLAIAMAEPRKSGS